MDRGDVSPDGHARRGPWTADPVQSGPSERIRPKHFSVGPQQVRRWGPRRFPFARVIRTLGSAAGVLGALDIVYWLGLRHVYNLTFALAVLPQLLKGFEITTEVIGVVIPVGFGVGFLVGWARTSRHLFLRGFCALYVDFFRSMPPIVLILFAFLIGLLGLKYLTSDPFLAHTVGLWFGALALGLHTGAYQAEIVRAGILSVPAGQTDASDSIGVSRTRTMFVVVLPQAFRVALPALGNEFSSVIKDSSLLSIIGWQELTNSGQDGVYGALKFGLQGPIILWIEIAIFYFIITFALNSVVRGIENRFKVPGLAAAQP